VGDYRAGASEDSTEQWLVGVYRPGVSGCLHSRGNCGLYRAGVRGFHRARNMGSVGYLQSWMSRGEWISTQQG
jgi:hypothetical protein